MSSIIPKKLAIYYGYPSSLNYPTNNYNLNAVANDFAEYDMVILGAGLEQSSHEDHNNTKSIIAKSSVSNVDFYGYVTSTDATNTIKSQINKWANMGTRLRGILLKHMDDIAKSKQNLLIDYVHSKGLIAIVHGSDINAILSESLLTSSDWYLYEHYQIQDGGWVSESNWVNSVDILQNYDINVAAVSTGGSSTYSQDKFNYGYYSCIFNEFAAFCWGEEYFAAQSAIMPMRARPNIIGDRFTDSPVIFNGVYERNLNIGISINISTYLATQSLNLI